MSLLDYINLFTSIIITAFIIYASAIAWLAFFTGNFKPIDRLREGFKSKGGR